MFKIIIERKEQNPILYHVENYQIIDDGNTIRFYDTKHEEFKRIPYKDCRIIEVLDDE